MLRSAHGGCSRCLSLQGALAPPLPPGFLQASRTKEAAIRFTSARIVARKTPKGFGPPPPAPKSTKTSPADPKDMSKTDKVSSDASTRDGEDDVVPEVVMDRMIKRIGFSIAVPIGLAVLVFPSFWYLKVQLRLDVPEWLPLLVSGLLFCSAALGITYGILSTSWDPLRDGSFVGWKEAKSNWPIFFNSLQGSKDKK